MKPFLFALLLLLSAGPAFSQAWHQTDGPYAGGARALTQMGKYLIAGQNGVYISADSGKHWTLANNGMTPMLVYALAVKRDTVLAATLDGLYLSTDTCKSWRPAEKKGGLTRRQTNTVLVVGSTIYCGNVSVCKSTDNGKTWKVVNTGMTGAGNIYALAYDGTTLYAGDAHGKVYTSTNGGALWSNPSNGPSSIDVICLMAHDTTVFAGTLGGFYKTSDHGATWTKCGTLFGGNIYAMAAIGNRVFAGSFMNGLYVCTDGGTNWTRLTNGVTERYFWAMHATPDSTLYAGSLGAVFASYNKGASWALSNTGIGNCYIHSMATKGNDLYVGTFGQGIYKTPDNGNTWNKVSNGLSYDKGQQVLALLVDGANMYAGTDSGVYVTTNDGALWTSCSMTPYNNFIFSMARNSTHVFAGGIGVYVSSGLGQPFNASGLSGKRVNALAAYGEHIIAGTDDGIFRTKDNGVTWLPIDSGLLGGDKHVYALVVKGKKIIAGVNSAMQMTADTGHHWTPSFKGMANSSGYYPAVWALAQGGGKIFAGTYTGIAVSTDNGANWVMDSFVNAWCNTIALNGPFVLGGMNGRGLWVNQAILGAGEADKLPVAADELLVYPNPARNELSVQLPAEAYIRLTDLMGRTFIPLPGHAPGTIDVSHLSPGLYLLSVQTAEGVRTAKLVKE